ncbi:MAG: c-type cytochrome [Nitrospirota bacterium]|nr:c-type cytochrome [Nitrospirota bacterium]MDE3119296.1 c-type cytochrome [Nitrospirota bacterium]MDE3243355.1 c-type cytochrome [Nitrospirota bacterium]
MSDLQRGRVARGFFLVGAVFLALTIGSRWLASRPAPQHASPAVPQIAPSMIPLVTGDEPLAQLFIRAGCPVCHTIPGIAGADGKVGPKLVLGETGRRRLADPNYRGQATSVHEYVIESILTPGAYVVPGYPDRTMPPWYGQKLSAAALDKIATYLETLGTDAPPARP